MRYRSRRDNTLSRYGPRYGLPRSRSLPSQPRYDLPTNLYSVLIYLGLGNITGLSLGDALSTMHVLEHVQITYGAIILSFLGALHWGMEFSKMGGEHGYYRLAIGTLPVLFAWPTTFLSHGIALAIQWFGFTGMWIVDQRVSTMGWSE